MTRLYPTLITNSFEGLATGFASDSRRVRAITDWANRMVCGCHLEGPYISAEDGPRGAHPKQHVRPADWLEFQKGLQEISRDNRIRLVTPGSRSGQRDRIHSDGRRRQWRRRRAGSYSGRDTRSDPGRCGRWGDAEYSSWQRCARAMIHRHRNVIFEQLADSRLHASLIVDGHHLPPNLVRTFFKLKTPQKTILTCDAAGWAGCPPGIYENKLGKSELLANGKLVVAGQRELLAGSAQGTDTCVAKAMAFAGISLKQAVDMASRNPARLLGHEVGRLRRGSLADLMLFRLSDDRQRLEIEATIASGELKFGKLVPP